ncbi:APC family permease [Roseiconus lacunae]|uniref:APC family permease n=1 Tax=Roseiconus lacunae TaxID=2605694 RepID=UPI001E3D7ADF|nr:APC family permease [Roseiconus lacunae]MCD0460623.1 APC family permease [Roseiconus lacunae]
MMGDRSANNELRREVGVAGAILLGLGSIVGTGVFVSFGVAAGVTGPSVILAVALAAAVASFNGLSSAQLAANHPVSGGTYEYGYRWLNPTLGFLAGWMFLCAKAASAATAALGCSGYLLEFVGGQPKGGATLPAVLIVVVVTSLLCFGIRRSNQVNAVVVAVTLGALTVFVIAGVIHLSEEGLHHFTPFWRHNEDRSAPTLFLEATALMFVAFTGYGRIATLSEEVHDPKRTIPRAIVATLLISALLYGSVSAIAVGVLGPDRLVIAIESHVAPLQLAAGQFSSATITAVIAFGAITAMLGVLLNLLLGLSRVVLAMGRRTDLPHGFSRVSAATHSPVAATVAVGLVVAAICLVGNVATTWSFSALTVLVYYALTNAAALRLSDEERFYPRWVSWLGLGSCLSLAFFISWIFWIYGAILLFVGLLSRQLSQRFSGKNDSSGTA